MTDDGKITRADVEGKARQLQAELERTGEAAKGPGLVVAGVVVVVLIGVAFLLGKRRGKRMTTTVEIRRV